MKHSLKNITLPLSLLVIAFMLAPHRTAAQQVQPAQKAGNNIGTGTYSPSTSRLSSASTLGPAGSYGGAFTTTNQQNAAGLLNGANSKSKVSAERSLGRSAWSGSTSSFSTHGASAWTAGAHAFGGNQGSAWTAGARSFGIPVQAGGVWRSTPSTGFPSVPSAGISKASALAAGAVQPTSSFGSGSLPGASSAARSGLVPNVRQLGQSLRGTNGGKLGSSLPPGIREPFGKTQQFAGPFGASGSRTRSFGGRGTGTSTSAPQGLQPSHQSGSGALSNPLSNNHLHSSSQLNNGTGSDSNGLQSNGP